MIQPNQAIKPDQRSIKINSALAVWLLAGSWGATVMIVAVFGYLILSRGVFKDILAEPTQPMIVVTQESSVPDTLVGLPAYNQGNGLTEIRRVVNPHTVLINRSREGAVEYTVQKSDSVFSIANKYKLKPETVLWANYSLLNDNPNFLAIGQVLKIPPTDGIYYQWKEGDILEKVSGEYKVTPNDILSWPQNKLDMANPVIEPGSYIMIPGGWRANQQWVIPTAWVPRSGTIKSIDGPGGCELAAGGAYGSGSFVWPADNHYVSGNDYWSGHLAIDIATAGGAPIYAADGGVVVYSGSIGGGYGIMIMIDHGTGYHTLYAHLSEVLVRCGQSVSQGALIGRAGSTGNSTGPHLHFEVRYNGGFVNPWTVLP